MKWISHDIEKYIKLKEYVDTALIPLIPISFGAEMKQASLMSEYITLLASLLERQFTGRLLLLPPFTYIYSIEKIHLLMGLKNWITEMKNSSIVHIFFFTSDSEWKIHEKCLLNSLVLIPTLPLEHFEDSQKITIVENQLKELTTLFTRKWYKYK